MKKNIIAINLIMFIIILLIALYIVNYNIRENNRTQEIIQLSENYLYERYSKKPFFDKKPNYYDSVYFMNNVHFENEDTHFQVRYVFPSSHFEDDYIQDSINLDLKNLIEDELESMGIHNSSVFIGPLHGRKDENLEKLYDRYSSLNVIPKFNDYKDIINYDYITISNNIGFSDMEKLQIKSFLKKLKLSVNKIVF